MIGLSLIGLAATSFSLAGLVVDDWLAWLEWLVCGRCGIPADLGEDWWGMVGLRVVLILAGVVLEIVAEVVA
jgi:hypothetical protein